MKAANLPTFLKFGNAKKSDICYLSLQKIMSGHETGGGLEPTWGACASSGPGLKPPLAVEV